MHHYMPEIFYHDRKALLSVDIHPVADQGHYKIATASVQNEVRIWDFVYETINMEIPPIVVNFIANLEGHSGTINQVKFSQNPEYNLLASGDVHGRISIWQLSEQSCTLPALEGFPQNKENWIRIKVINHESDVTALCWSPCGKFLASVSNDNSLQVHEAISGKRQFIVSSLRHFPNGVAYDPLGKYIITMSTDRRMDLLCALKGTRLRSFGLCELPEICLGDISVQSGTYKLFHDDQLNTFTRSCSFSPCGQIIVAPVGRLEVGSHDIYCTYVFKRWELEKDRPAIILPCPDRPPFCIKFCPLIFELVKDSENYSGLPYRLIWLAATRETIIIYDSQHPRALAMIDKISYNHISDAAWSKDGKNIVISSMEGYCHYVKFNVKSLGVQIEIDSIPLCPESPHFVKKKRKDRKTKEALEESIATPVAVTPSKKLTGTTPKSARSGGQMMRYLKKTKDDSPVSLKSTSTEVNTEPKVKKRLELISLD